MIQQFMRKILLPLMTLNATSKLYKVCSLRWKESWSTCMVLTLHSSHHTSMNFWGGWGTRMSLIFVQLSFHAWLTSFLFRPLFTLCFRHSTLLSSTSALYPPAFVNMYVCIHVKPVNKYVYLTLKHSLVLSSHLSFLIRSVVLVCSLAHLFACCHCQVPE